MIRYAAGWLQLSAKVNRAKYHYGMCMRSCTSPSDKERRLPHTLPRRICNGSHLSLFLVAQSVTSNAYTCSSGIPRCLFRGRHLRHISLIYLPVWSSGRDRKASRSSFHVPISPTAGWDDDETRPVEYVDGLTEVHAPSRRHGRSLIMDWAYHGRYPPAESPAYHETTYMYVHPYMYMC